MIRSMIAKARSKAGMPKNISGKPVKCDTNQSESITVQKEALAKNNKSKVDLTKLQFMNGMLEEVNRHQQDELSWPFVGLDGILSH